MDVLFIFSEIKELKKVKVRKKHTKKKKYEMGLL